MSICRVEKTKNYTVMSNTHLRDTKLSLKAIGLLSKVLSLPDEWDYSKAGLCAICKEGISTIDSAMSELREFGYLRVDKLTPDKTSSGRIEYIYTFFEIPKQEGKKQGVEKLGVEKLGVEVLDIEKHVQLNKDLLSTDELGTDELNKEHTYTVATATDHTPKLPIIYKDVIDYLNYKAGTNYQYSTKDTQRRIKARQHEGFTLEDFKTVIDIKCEDWLSDAKMSQYIRPQTLFGANFESYLNQQTKRLVSGGTSFFDIAAEMENEYETNN